MLDKYHKLVYGNRDGLQPDGGTPMPVRGNKNPFPSKGKKGPSMFAATSSGSNPHTGLLADALKVSPPQKPKRGTTKTLSR